MGQPYTGLIAALTDRTLGMTIETLITRATVALGVGATLAEAAESLIVSGTSPEMAFLAVQAAAILARDGEDSPMV